jgi:polyisoprenoid-binding protein YceI
MLAEPASLGAQPCPYMIDVAHSYVEFQIRYLGLFTLGGRFSGLAGTLVFDKDHWDTLDSRIEIPVDSLQARPSLWRATLLGPVYFDQSHFPTIGFAATHAGRTGPTSGEAEGILTIRGATRPVALSMHVAPGEQAIDISAETMLKRSNFALGGVLPFASDDVSVILRLRVLPAAPR